MVVCASQPMHDDYDLRQEQLNKASIMSSKAFLENLLEMFNAHVVSLLHLLFGFPLLFLLSFVFCFLFLSFCNGPCSWPKSRRNFNKKH